jgi:hypothetical protein
VAGVMGLGANRNGDEQKNANDVPAKTSHGPPYLTVREDGGPTIRYLQRLSLHP